MTNNNSNFKEIKKSFNRQCLDAGQTSSKIRHDFILERTDPTLAKRVCGSAHLIITDPYTGTVREAYPKNWLYYLERFYSYMMTPQQYQVRGIARSMKRQYGGKPLEWSQLRNFIVQIYTEDGAYYEI